MCKVKIGIMSTSVTPKFCERQILTSCSWRSQKVLFFSWGMKNLQLCPTDQSLKSSNGFIKIIRLFCRLPIIHCTQVEFATNLSCQKTWGDWRCCVVYWFSLMEMKTMQNILNEFQIQYCSLLVYKDERDAHESPKAAMVRGCDQVHRCESDLSLNPDSK